jgi:integrase
LIHKLNPQTVARLVAKGKPGVWNDGGKLYLQIGPTGSAAWVFRYRFHGEDRWMGLGPVHTVSLAKARDEAAVLRVAVRDGLDPIGERGAAIRKAVTFAECCKLFLAEQTAELPRWEQTLRDYCGPLADMPVSAITTDHVLGVLRPLWREHVVTGRRVQARIARIFAFAKLKGFCSGDNVADWKTRLSMVLASPSNHVVEHHAAMSWRNVPSLMAKLRKLDDIRARALEFVILTGCRSGDILGQPERRDAKPPIRWDDIDFEARLWRVPSPKGAKKGEEPFVVPLSEPLLASLCRIKAGRPHDVLVFSSEVRPGQPIARKSLRSILEPLAPDVSVHGFRSSFRDWASEHGHKDKLAELALNHRMPGTKVTRAYERTQLLNQRRVLMEDWSRYCLGDPAGVVAVAA